MNIKIISLFLSTLCVLLFALCSQIFSATLLGRQFGFGDIREGLTARQTGMGETKIAVTEDPSAVFINPAQLSAIDGKLNLIVAPSLHSSYEKATHADASKSFNENSFNYAELPLFAASYSLRRWTLSVGWGTLNDFRYFYENKSFSEGRLTSSKRAEDFGDIRVLAGGASYRFQYGSFGISYLAYRGTPDFNYESLSYNLLGQVISSDIRTSHKIFGGRQVMGGISIFPTRQITIGTFLKGRYTMSEDVRKVEQGIYGQTGRQWWMPWEFGAGFSYRFSNLESKPVMAFDCIKKWWSQTRVSTDGGPYQNAGFIDTLSYHVGMEHRVTSKIPFRYGLSFVPFYGRGEADLFTVTLGSGYSWDWGSRQISLEVSGGYQMRSTSNTDRLFSEPGDPQFPYINQDVVDSYVKRFIASISYHF